MEGERGGWGRGKEKEKETNNKTLADTVHYNFLLFFFSFVQDVEYSSGEGRDVSVRRENRAGSDSSALRGDHELAQALDKRTTARCGTKGGGEVNRTRPGSTSRAALFARARKTVWFEV